MTTREELKKCGIVPADLISSSQYDAIKRAMDNYANDRLSAKDALIKAQEELITHFEMHTPHELFSRGIAETGEKLRDKIKSLKG